MSVLLKKPYQKEIRIEKRKLASEFHDALVPFAERRNIDMRQNDGVNMLKGIACIIVVFLHISFPGILGKVIGFELNFSVPVFFMISGYFAYKKNDFLWCKRKAVQLLKMLLVTEFVYGVWNFIKQCVIENGTFINFINENSLIKNPVRTILCGTIYNGTLWYVYAAMWTWVIYSFLMKKNMLKKNAIYWIIIPLLFVQIFVKLYWMNHYNISETIYLFRNFAVFGLPMTLLGSWISRNHEKWNWSCKKSMLVIAGGHS